MMERRRLARVALHPAGHMYGEADNTPPRIRSRVAIMRKSTRVADLTSDLLLTSRGVGQERSMPESFFLCAL